MNAFFFRRLSAVALTAPFAVAVFGLIPQAAISQAMAEHHVPGRLTPYANCRLCHGDDLLGGIGRSCHACHDRVWPGGETPPVADTRGPYSGEVGLEVAFDGTGSIDLDGAVVSYLWDFGDGAVSAEAKPRHAYDSIGSYTVALTVTDDSGNTDVANTVADIVASTANVPPLADASGPYSGGVGVAVQFDGSSSIDVDGTIVSYDWDFGDGSVGTGANPTHTYAAVGVYMVRLTVTDDVGATDAADTGVTVGLDANRPPVVDAGGPYTGIVGQDIQFDASNTVDPDGDDLIFLWNFGDGSQPPMPSQSPTTSHAYSQVGTYTVQVVVSDGTGVPVIEEVEVTITDDDDPGVTPPPGLGEMWEMRIATVADPYVVSFQELSGLLLVETTDAYGDTSFGIGMRSGDVILWIDVVGAVFFGNIDDSAGTMSGVLFNGADASSIWFAERL